MVGWLSCNKGLSCSSLKTISVQIQGMVEVSSTQVLTERWKQDTELWCLITVLERQGLDLRVNPTAEFMTIVGRPTVGMGKKNTYVGEESVWKSEVELTLTSPIESGIVTNWYDMEKVCYTDFIKTSPSEQPLLLTQDLIGPKVNREKTTQILFETFDIPALFIYVPAVLALYASGRTTGLVFDSGYGVTHAVPIWEGYAFPHAILRLDLAGKDVNESLLKWASNFKTPTGYSSIRERELIQDVKHKLCCVVLNYKEEIKKGDSSSALDITYELPDGNVITIGKERIQVPEALFQPGLIGRESKGFHVMLHDSIMRVDVDERGEMYKNIVLAGGNTMLVGFKERLEEELRELKPTPIRMNVIAPTANAAWKGGSITGSCAQQWLSRAEYDESGPTIVHRTCY